MPRPLPEGTLTPAFGTVQEQRERTLIRLREQTVLLRTEVERLRRLIAEHQLAIEEPRNADYRLWRS